MIRMDKQLPFKKNLPLNRAIRTWQQSDPWRFMMPGHKGCGPLGDTLDVAGDLTEIPVLDDLHHPAGVLLETEAFLREVFGSGATIPLVNGAGAGIRAALLAAGGGPVVVPRNAHRAVLEGLILSGGDPYYVQPEVRGSFLTPASPSRYEVYPGSWMRVVLTESYEGFIRDYRGISGEGFLLADEAHGSHLGFLGLPSAQSYADATVHGAHKTLGSLTQSALLHLKDPDWVPSLRRALALVESTSPSWLLLASLEKAAAWWGEFRDPGELLERVEIMRRRLERIPGFRQATAEPEEDLYMDPLRVTLEVDSRRDGRQLMLEMSRDCGLELELGAPGYITGILSPFDSGSAWDQLVKVLENLSIKHNMKDHFRESQDIVFGLPEKLLTPREAWFGEKIRMRLDSSGGRIAADIVAAYPPGIPLICPGEIIPMDLPERIRSLQAGGVHIQGLGPDDTILIMRDS